MRQQFEWQSYEEAKSEVRQMSKRITRVLYWNKQTLKKKSGFGNEAESKKNLEGQELNKFLEMKGNNSNNFLEDEANVLLQRLLAVSSIYSPSLS